MANKYCNLDGSKKIKDEYQKINIGFDKVEEDVNKINDDINALDERVDEIITTPVEDVSAEEIIDARGGRPVLGKRFEDIEDEFDAHKAETVPHAELANRTITVGVGKDFTTIQGAINSLKKRIDAIITINVDAGTYAENVEIFGFYGRGSLIINGGSDLESAANYVVNGFFINKCNGISVNIQGFEGVDNTFVFRGRGSTYVEFRYCRTESLSEYGFMFEYGCNGWVNSCLASNKSVAALMVNYSSTVFSTLWTAGSNNTRGIYCRGASTVGKYGTQPQGATAEVADQGGAIR